MTISRITTWVDGQILTAAALNNEFNNIISNATALISPLTTSLNFNGNQALELVLENRVASPSPNVTGQIYFYTPEELVIVKGGTHTDILVGPSEGVSRVQGLSGSMISNIGSFQANSYQMVRNVAQRLTISVTATSSFSINTQTAGPVVNGRDQAAAFGSTDVHFYAIATGPFSTAPQGICSSTPPPIGPNSTSYLYWAYLGSAKYNTATSVIGIGLESIISGSRVRYTASPPPALIAVTATNTALTSATVAPLTYVPRNATQMLIRPSLGGSHTALGTLNIVAQLTPSSSAPLIDSIFVQAQGAVAAGQTFSNESAVITFPVIESTPLLYSQIFVNTGLDATLTVRAEGYIVANGDN